MGIDRADHGGMAKDDVMVLNDYGGGSFSRRTPQLKSGKAGKARYTVEIRSDPLLVQTDPKALGAAPAIAIRDHLKQRVGDISETASQATIKARLSAQKAVMTGQPWAMKRYSGGRIGTRAPARTDRLFNDSGRLVESIAVAARGDSWIINVAGNRFDPSTLNGGEAALLRIIERLRELVPEWGDARKLVDVLSVQRAIRSSLADAIVKATERTKDLQKQLLEQTFGRVLRLVA
jgi:hypothetical protein